jgi:RNA polymerase sigma factor (sigma-70 family)
MMGSTEALTRVVEQFAHSAWNLASDELRAQECALRKILNAHQLNAAAMIQVQTGETLALALQKDFFFDQVYNEFVGRYEVQIWSCLMDETKEYHLARDLTQDVLVRCWQGRLRSYTPSEGKLGPYLFAMARNRFREWRRQRKNQPCSQLPPELPQPEVETTDLEDEEARDAAQTFARRVREALVQLPPGQREALQLLLGGKSHDEIAAELGITVSASQMAVFRARRTLERLLGLTLPPTNRGRPREGSPRRPTRDLSAPDDQMQE